LAKIAVVNVPFNSHTEAAIRLTSVLVRQGHEVVSWGAARHREQIEAAGARFVLHEPEMHHGGDFMTYVTATAKLAEQSSGELIEQLFAYGADLLVHDDMALWARIAGDYLGVPRVASHPMFPIVDGHRVIASDELPPPACNDEMAKAQFEASQASIAKRWGVYVAQEEVLHSRAPATVAYTTQKILGGFELLPGWQLVGPLMTPRPATAPAGARPLVYVCFGTSYNRRTELYRTVIDALAEEPFDVLVSRGREVAWDTLGPVPSNVNVRDFVPNREALAQASLHITHGGCNSVHETLLAGVPMVCMPQAYDQFPLCGRIQLLGAGVIVEERREAIGEAVRLVLDSDKARARAREVAEHLASYDAESQVAEVIERSLAPEPVPSA
jgi:MGT family glycosyltransferase